MADKENNGGYDYEFVEEPPDSLKCLICLLVVRDPQQHGDCGKLFCKSCITRYRHRTQLQIRSCPYCRRPLTGINGYSSIFKDAKSNEEVKSLGVWCKTGCGWRGELRSVEDHVKKECMNTLVPCPNSCGNGSKKIARKNLKAHLRLECPKRLILCLQCDKVIEFRLYDYHLQNECPKRQYCCPNCNEMGIYDERTTTHLNDCPKVKIPCTKCTLRVNRCDQPSHPSVCQYEPAQCKYHHIGCGEWPLRKDLQAHELDAQLHLALATERVLTPTDLVVAKNTLTYRVTGFVNKKASNDTPYSPRFHTSPSGYMMCLRVDTNGWGDGKGIHISVYVYLMKGDNDDSLTWPFTGTVTVELLNQLANKNHRKGTITFPVDSEASQRVVDGVIAQKGRGSSKFISHTDLEHKPGINRQYLKDDTLVFRVSAEASDYKPWLECTN